MPNYSSESSLVFNENLCWISCRITLLGIIEYWRWMVSIFFNRSLFWDKYFTISFHLWKSFQIILVCITFSSSLVIDLINSILRWDAVLMNRTLDREYFLKYLKFLVLLYRKLFMNIMVALCTSFTLFPNSGNYTKSEWFTSIKL